MKNIIIIGSEGFTAKYLVKSLLDKNYNCIKVDKLEKDFNEYYQCDINKKDTLNRIPLHSNDIVIHLAAVQYDLAVPNYANREKYFLDTNYLGTKNVLEWMYKANCSHMIYFSSDMVYGQPQAIPINENHPRNPFGYYGLSKKMTEDLCYKYIEKYGFNITIFRPRLIMGPGRLGILKKLFQLIKLNMPVPLIGNGNNYYQMISVYDCVDAIAKAIKLDVPNSTINLGSATPPTVRILLDKLIKSVGSKSITTALPAKPIKLVLYLLDRLGISIMYPEQYMIADENYLLDIKKAQNVINWHPQFSDQDMIIQAYDYYIKGKQY